MSRERIAWIVIGAVVVTVSALLLLLPNGDTRSENASEFRSNVGALDPGIEIKLVEGSDPGTVEGTFLAPDGKQSSFVFSFGPDPVDDLRRYEEKGAYSVEWYNGGDEFYAALDQSSRRMSKTQWDRFYAAQMAIEDAACQAVSGQNCKGV